MNPRTRIIAIRLVQRIKKNPEYAKKIGVEAKFLIFPKEKTC